jgi:TonB family protein
MFRMLQEGGWPAWLSLFVGVFALLAAGGGLVSLAFSKRVAFVVGTIALALSSLAAIVGALGVAWGHRQVEQVRWLVDNAATQERLVAAGYAEAANCGIVGFAAAIVPIVLGAIAALVGSRAAPPQVVPHWGPMDAFRGPSPPVGPPPGPGMGRTVAALVAAGFATLCALAALGTSFSKPPPGKYALDVDDRDGWRLAEAHATLGTPGMFEDGCDALDEALSALRVSGPREVPPRFGRNPDSIVPGTTAEATRCARDVFERVKKGKATRKGAAPSAKREWTREELLGSPLLLDAALRREIEEWPPAPPPQVGLPSWGSAGGPPRQGSAIGGVPQEYARAIGSHSGDVRGCYDQALRRTPNLNGQAKLQITIGPKGGVQSAKIVDSTLNDAALEACILGKVRGWTLPPPPDGKTLIVTYPYRFEP